MVTDRQEETIDIYVTHLFIGFTFAIDKVSSLHFAIACELDGIMLKKDFNLWIIEHALLHDFRCAEVGFAYDEVHFLAQSREVVCFFASGVTTTDNSHCFLAIEETIASSACAHSSSTISAFGLQAKVFSTGPRSDNNRVCLI